MTSDQPTKPATTIVTAGRDPAAHFGFVNPPVYHGSTILYPTARDLVAHRSRYQYGRRGTPTSEALEAALAGIEGPECAGVALAPSGLSAIATALLSSLNAGDHILIQDNVYRPTRVFADGALRRLGVETTYFDPAIGADVASLMRPNTKIVFVEAPGSQSFEMPDVPLIAGIAHERGALVFMDNTYATPLYFPALSMGVDVSIQAGTKYIVGHSDVMLGAVSANARAWPALRDYVHQSGLCVGPDDIYLALRGFRTLGIRLERHQQSALTIAQYLSKRTEVARVLHPAFPNDPGHAIWKRDFSGSTGLFSVILKPVADNAVYAFLDCLRLFGMGFSWGGYESLVILFDCSAYRTATKWNPGGPALRFFIGLEDPSDLIADLDAGFDAMAKSRDA